jgi:hypothetical protein
VFNCRTPSGPTACWSETPVAGGSDVSMGEGRKGGERVLARLPPLSRGNTSMGHRRKCFLNGFCVCWCVPVLPSLWWCVCVFWLSSKKKWLPFPWRPPLSHPSSCASLCHPDVCECVLCACVRVRACVCVAMSVLLARPIISTDRAKSPHR